jgi:DnaJ-class molecular chaperone
MQDHYEKLGVPPAAAPDLIKLAYRKKAAQYHPDKNAAADAALRFREVQDAYEVLSDPVQRAAYDAFRQRSLIDDPLAVAQALAEHYIQGITR